MITRTFAPLSTRNTPVPDVDALAQCTRCKQLSSYDRLDAMLGRALVCACGAQLRLYAFAERGAGA